ncbi:MAG: hypothetical protein KAV87_20920 [Desulfobacteraceae bacterium]|nr:hypothetical protein [Desulfobacteraceae bacterium]
MSKDTFALIGVIFTAICVLGGLGVVVSNVTGYLFERMKNTYKLTEIKKAWREYEERKAHSTEPP